MNETAIQKTQDESAFELVQRRAKAYAHSTIVPQIYQGEQGIPNVIIAMEYADRLGSNPLAIMQSMYVVHGNPSFSSTFLIGTVNACGRFSPLRFKMEGSLGKMDYGCRAYAMDKESGEECMGPLVNMQMAEDEGWLGKKGSKWKTMPELMLHYRAATFWTRLYAPELSLGLHTVEEHQDIEAGKAEIVVEPGKSQLDALTEELEKKQKEVEPEQEREPGEDDESDWALDAPE